MPADNVKKYTINWNRKGVNTTDNRAHSVYVNTLTKDFQVRIGTVQGPSRGHLGVIQRYSGHVQGMSVGNLGAILRCNPVAVNGCSQVVQELSKCYPGVIHVLSRCYLGFVDGS